MMNIIAKSPENTLWHAIPSMEREMLALERYLHKRFPPGNNRFENHAIKSLLHAGGKRLRPAMAIAAAHCGEYVRERVLPAAAAVELLHTASLVHDDIVDEAATRRGVTTLSHAHGNTAAVYAGDFLLAEAMLVLSESPLEKSAAKRLAQGVKAMCAGEIDQYFSRNTVPALSEYLKRIMRKTALLFAAACGAGASCTGCSDRDIRTLGLFGFHFGVAFQIRDDLLDVTRESRSIGKPTGSDLANGLMTLPVLLAIEQDPALNASIQNYLLHRKGEPAALLDAVRRSDGPRLARSILIRYVQKCERDLAHLSPGIGCEALSMLPPLLSE